MSGRAFTRRLGRGSPQTRRSALKLAAGTAFAGVTAVVLGPGKAHADTCVNQCLNWLSQCADWCDVNDTSDACYQACKSNGDECQDCCNESGDSGECVPPAPPATDYLVAWANALVVSAELGYTGTDYGMLRARAGSVGPWEKIDILELSSGTYALRSRANGLYVSAELGYGTSNPRYGMLRARSSSIGPWETFTSEYVPASSHGSYRLVGNNGQYVSTEAGYGTSNPLYGVLRARASSVGPWEQYNWIPIQP